MLSDLLRGDLRRRTGFRFGLTLAVLLAAGMLAMFAATFWLGSAALLSATDRSVREQVDLLGARPPEMIEFMIASRLGQGPAVVTLVGLYRPDGTLIVGDIGPEPPAVPADGAVHSVSVVELDGTVDQRRVAARRLPDGRFLAVGRSVAEILAVRGDLLRALMLGLVPAVLLSLGGGVLIGMRTERRLAAVRAAAARIMAGHLDERLPVGGRGDDLDQLCRISNQILARTEELVMALRAAGENIAHDVRTPLTAVRMRLERARLIGEPGWEPLVERSIEGIDQVLAIVTALLRIAEIEHGRRVAGFVPFDLAAVMRDAAETFAALAEEKGVLLDVHPSPPIMVVGDRDLVTEAIVNLLDNAVKFTPAGGRVDVSLVGEPNRPVLRVADSGPGIPTAEREAVFRRFHRGERSRTTPGSGLGLNLVAAIARLHGFGVRLGDNEPGCTAELLCWPGADEPGGDRRSEAQAGARPHHDRLGAKRAVSPRRLEPFHRQRGGCGRGNNARGAAERKSHGVVGVAELRAWRARSRLFAVRGT